MALLAVVPLRAAATADWSARPAELTPAPARITAATPQQRTLSVRGNLELGDQPTAALDRFRSSAGATDTTRAERSITGVRLAGIVRSGNRELSAELRTRDDICANVTMIAGRCATADGEVMIGVDLATALGVQPGAPLRHEASLTATPADMLIVGVFEPLNPVGWYWAGQEGIAAFTTLGTIAREKWSIV